MNRSTWIISTLAALALSACSGSSVPEQGRSAAPSATAAAMDAELEQLEAMIAPDACAWLTQDVLRAAYPDLSFEVKQALKPQISGYVWDSRCIYWAGVGTIEFAKEAPTHTVEIFVATSASEAKAQARLASRREGAQSTRGYQAQPALGADAYSTSSNAIASLFFTKGASEVQINVSDLDTPNEQKVLRAVALAESL